MPSGETGNESTSLPEEMASKEVDDIVKSHNESNLNSVPEAEDQIAKEKDDDAKLQSQSSTDAKKSPKRIRTEDPPVLSTDEDGWLDILGSGDLKKKVIKAGGGVNTRPRQGNWVTLRLLGKLSNGTIVEEHDQMQIVLGDSDVVHGLDAAIALMEKGEIADIVVPPRLAYGSFGKLPNIPPESELVYTVELLDIRDAEEETSLPLADRLRIGVEKRENGNSWYGRGNYSTAIHCYNRSLEFLDTEDQNFDAPASELQILLEERLKVYNNLAAAQMKMEAYDAALKSVEFVLKVQAQNVKALFRKGKILSAKGEVDAAISQLKRALKLEPETKIIHQELARLLSRKKNEVAAEKNMYKRMFGHQDKPKPKVSPSRFKWSIATVVGGSLAVVASILAYRHFHPLP